MPILRCVCAGAAAMALLGGAVGPARADAPKDGVRGTDWSQLDHAMAYRRDAWTGFYIGASLETGWGWSVRQVLGPRDIDMRGFGGGGQLGYNLRRGAFVGGLEIDAGWSGLDGSRNISGFVTAAGIDVDWTASLRGRAGFTWDRLLIYGTGGIAAAGMNLDVATQKGLFSTPDVRTGFVYGGGVEALLAPRISGRIEVLRYNLGDSALATAAGPLSGMTEITSIRAGLNWHFD